MDKKSTSERITRADRPKKRRFHGYRHTVEESTIFTSSSAAKLSKSKDEEFIIENNSGYCILEFFTVFSAISSLVLCTNCKKEIKFSRTAQRGVGFKITLQCSCESIQYISSCPLIEKSFEVNRKVIFAMRFLGVGREGINIFCSLMDICQGLSIGTYYASMKNIHIAASAVYNLVISKAVKEEKDLISACDPNANPTEFTVSGDGTWKKRGFNSLFGVTTLVAKNCKKVVDTVVKSSFCQGCNLWKNKKKSDILAYNDWYEDHEEVCTINHKGSAGKMEVDAVVEMFCRSVEKHGVKYVKYIGDGDTKTFKGILNMDPYDGDPVVEKKECVGHVQKRMGARLRKAKKASKGIGGKGEGKLTDKIINKLSLYYGLAIRRHPDSVEDMKNAVLATYYHNSSTDEDPQHTYCPPGAESWCAWRKAASEGTEEEFEHDNVPLCDEVLKVIRPIYDSLSSNELLTRCLGSETQNNNESLNSLIWTFAPKHIHSGSQVIEIATFIAVCIFNDGFFPILKMMTLMGMQIGPETHSFAVRRDNARIERSEIRTSNASKEARTARLEERNAENSFLK
ncbi:uncharacterized protein LOC141529520 [Cotesia typhae]|uniref:uncharacterized protein LOC141529520 n=1 Tax=Cotesia typhae TaxID=2053667 RepID=UPI003D68EACC